MGDLGSIPGLERSPRDGKGFPLWYSGLENSMDCILYGGGCKESDTTGQLSLSLSPGPVPVLEGTESRTEGAGAGGRRSGQLGFNGTELGLLDEKSPVDGWC